METTMVYWGYIGIMENNMAATIVYIEDGLDTVWGMASL